MTRAELPVLRAYLVAERRRTREVVTELDELRVSVGSGVPTSVELMAAAGFLHNVYSGLENCLLRVAHGVDESVPAGPDSHRLLIDQMSVALPGLRPAVLDADLVRRLDEYRRFRHPFRHMYFFDLDWDRVRPLVDSAAGIVAEVETALDALLSALDVRAP